MKQEPAVSETDLVVEQMLQENERRKVRPVYRPLTGEGVGGNRVRLTIKDFPLPVQYVPARMADTPLFKALDGKSIKQFLSSKGILPGSDGYEDERDRVVKQVIWERCRALDFVFWCAMFVYIHNKETGEDVRFSLRRPQRRLADKLLRDLEAGKPLRLVMLKARQWGGSTLLQVVMCFIQLVVQTGRNSLIVSHEKTSSAEIKGMFDKIMEYYPAWMLNGPGAAVDEKAPKTKGSRDTPNITEVPARNCKVKIGTAERPDSARGGDSMLVHCSEVAFWRLTEGKRPEDIVRSACAGVLYLPNTLAAYESTAHGRENFFYEEYQAAKKHESQFDAFFVPWYEIEFCTLSPRSFREFARWLYENRFQTKAVNRKTEPGSYLWRLWEHYGCTLENINWYIKEREKYNSHSDMAAENPTDDIEAFASTGTAVFDQYRLSDMEAGCRTPDRRGDITGAAPDGPDALRDVRFTESADGEGSMWADVDRETRCVNRYLVIVDVGGRSSKADFSDILVLDRLGLIFGDGPEVVYEWHGHCRHDVLAWKAAQVAEYYNHALLVIESNTLETKEKERDLDGELTEYILDLLANQYDNLYTRPASAEKVRQGIDKEYGFHTNTKTKPAVIQHLVACIEDRLYTERCSEAITEMSYYEKHLDGTYGNVPGGNRHDDRVMVRAIGLYVSEFKMEAPVIEDPNPEDALPASNVDSYATLI